MRTASCQLPCAGKSDSNVVADCDAATAAELAQIYDADAIAAEHGIADVAAAEHGEPGKVVSVCDESGLPLELPAEFVIGVQECDTHDPVDPMVAFQKSMELVHELGGLVHAAAQKRAHAAADASAAAEGEDEVAQTAAPEGKYFLNLRNIFSYLKIRNNSRHQILKKITRLKKYNKQPICFLMLLLLLLRCCCCC